MPPKRKPNVAQPAERGKKARTNATVAREPKGNVEEREAHKGVADDSVARAVKEAADERKTGDQPAGDHDGVHHHRRPPVKEHSEITTLVKEQAAHKKLYSDEEEEEEDPVLLLNGGNTGKPLRTKREVLEANLLRLVNSGKLNVMAQCLPASGSALSDLIQAMVHSTEKETRDTYAQVLLDRVAEVLADFDKVLSDKGTIRLLQERLDTFPDDCTLTLRQIVYQVVNKKEQLMPAIYNRINLFEKGALWLQCEKFRAPKRSWQMLADALQILAHYENE